MTSLVSRYPDLWPSTTTAAVDLSFGPCWWCQLDQTGGGVRVHDWAVKGRSMSSKVRSSNGTTQMEWISNFIEERNESKHVIWLFTLYSANLTVTLWISGFDFQQHGSTGGVCSKLLWREKPGGTSDEITHNQIIIIIVAALKRWYLIWLLNCSSLLLTTINKWNIYIWPLIIHWFI